MEMPWKVSSVMDERLRFIARLLEGEAMTDLCIEFGISRKTGYKIYDRYKENGSEALSNRSKRPWRYANQLPPQLEAQIVGLKRDKPHWGKRRERHCRSGSPGANPNDLWCADFKSLPPRRRGASSPLATSTTATR
jgi:hypothetical protein